jgi:hypothetical protein
MTETYETYTYTARNVDDPDRVITFTLYGNYLRVNLTGLLDKLGKISESEERGEEVRRQLKTQLPPASMKLIEQFSGPIHVRDVDVRLRDDRLTVSAWQRLGGLRLAPVVFGLGEVDNPEGARAFVDEVEERRESSPTVSRFVGPLDYWAGWALLVGVIAILLRWPRRET